MYLIVKIPEKKQDSLLAPKKSLGQNFLTSVGALNKIVTAGNVTKNSIRILTAYYLFLYMKKYEKITYFHGSPST